VAMLGPSNRARRRSSSSEERQLTVHTFQSYNCAQGFGGCYVLRSSDIETFDALANANNTAEMHGPGRRSRILVRNRRPLAPPRLLFLSLSDRPLRPETRLHASRIVLLRRHRNISCDIGGVFRLGFVRLLFACSAEPFERARCPNDFRAGPAENGNRPRACPIRDGDEPAGLAPLGTHPHGRF
jgi:hypothetical protein